MDFKTGMNLENDLIQREVPVVLSQIVCLKLHGQS